MTVEQLVECALLRDPRQRFVVAAVITPPDVVSMLALLIPMCLLYEAGLFVARFVHKREAATDLSQKQT